MNLTSYTEWITKQGYRHIIGGEKAAILAETLSAGKETEHKWTHDIMTILEGRSDIMTVPTNNLAKTEDWLFMDTNCDRLLRHFHCVWFLNNDGDVITVLELAGKNEQGGLKWNLAYDMAAGFQSSTWAEQYAQSAIRNNPNLVTEAVEQSDAIEALESGDVIETSGEVSDVATDNSETSE